MALERSGHIPSDAIEVSVCSEAMSFASIPPSSVSSAELGFEFRLCGGVPLSSRYWRIDVFWFREEYHHTSRTSNVRPIVTTK